MRHRHTRTGIVCASILVITISCATPALWKRTEPTEYIVLSSEDASEEELRKKGVAYTLSDDGKFYFVEKSAISTFGNYALRLFGTPAAIALDAALGVVVGTAWLHAPPGLEPPVRLQERLKQMSDDDLLSYYQGLNDRLKDMWKTKRDRRSGLDSRTPVLDSGFELFEEQQWVLEELKRRKIAPTEQSEPSPPGSNL